MRPPIKVRRPTDAEQQALEAGLRSSDAIVLRRCQIVLASARGERVPPIARQLGCDDQTVRKAIHAFNARGPRRLAPGSRRPQTIRAGLRPAARRAAAGAAAPEPADLRQADQPVDAGPGRRGQLRAGADRRAGQRRDDPADAQAAGDRLEAGQALDHQPGPRVRPKKSSRDRLIRLAASHPTWVLGFQDEVWWSRLARPALYSWAEPDQPLRLVEQAVAKDDPDPKALACYGLLVRSASRGRRLARADLAALRRRPPGQRRHDRVPGLVLRQAGTRPGKEALLLVWDNAPWHVSRAVRAWIRAHNRQVKRTGRGVRIVACYLPIKSPWLNPIEPKWAHGKRRVVEPARLLSADELIDRVCAAFDCDHAPHLAIPAKVA